MADPSPAVRRRARLICLLAAACLAAAEALPAERQSFTESTDVVAVEVPVQVLGKDGEPVRGLTAADFEVWDGRKLQPITGFEVLDLTVDTPAAADTLAATAAPASPRPMPPPSARRRFVILFDLSFTDGPSLVKARQAARTLLSSGLQPSDLVAVAAYSASRGPDLILNFTSDRKQAAEALDRLGYVERAADPLRLRLPMAAGPRGGGDGRGQRRADTEANGDTGSSIDINAVVNAAAERAALASQQRDVVAFSRAVGAFAKMIGSVPGRKYVVFFSEGFQSSLLLGTADDEEIQQMNEASANGEYWKVNSDTRYGNTKLGGDVEKMIEELRRADCVVEAVDPGGLRAFGGDNGVQPGSGQDSLFVMADGTGGELYRNFNDLGIAMKEMLKRTSVTYVLSYQPDGLKRDGSYRKIRVELKNPPRGSRVVYRPGYYDPKRFSEQSQLEKVLDSASRVVNGMEGGSIDASVLAAPFRGTGDKAYVPVLIEVDGKSLLAGRQGNTLPVELYAYAFDAAGSVQDFFAKSIGLDLAKVEPVLQRSGLKLYGDLELAPGTYSLRVLVRNSASGALASRVLALTVPDLSKESALLLPPFFPEAPGSWLIVRENNEAPKGIPYPFQAESGPYIPSARPVLRPGQAAAVSLVGYHLRHGRLDATSLVLSADGREIGPGEIKMGQRQDGVAGEPDRLSATFRPPALQPGQYILLVTLTDAGGRAETSTTPFVVVGGSGAGVVGKGASG